MKHLLQLVLISLFPFVLFSQTPQQKKEITKDYDAELLNEFAKTAKAKAEFEKSNAIEQAQLNGWPLIMEENEKYSELMKVSKEGTPLYYSTFNVNAAKSSRANTLHNGNILGLNVEGQNMTAHVWDAGLARSTHQEYDGIGGNNRFSIGDGTTGLHYHSAHVTGTIIASGYVASAKGMAPQADAVGFEWNNDVSEAATAAGNGMLLSNHSYGWNIAYVQDWQFGAYASDSRDWDVVMYNAPYYLMVVAAGNEGNDNSSNGIPLDGNQYYDKLTGHSTTKNNMVVANAQDANINASNGNLISVSINSGSSEGPTDDYRIKPDIAGNGTGLYSTYEGSDNEYASISGTSMASPNVCGTLLLLQKHYNNLNPGFMRAATLKGLALHTADDAGPAGPDAVWGWGLMNAKAAANTISNNGVESKILELSLSQGGSYSINVESDGINDLIASISWTDPPGTANTGSVNNTTPVLVNDLDIRVTKGGSTYYPYKLTSITTNGTGDNLVDPYEKVIVGNASGSYTITITHKGSLYSGNQYYSLIVTGLASIPSPPAANFSADDVTPSVGQTVNFSDLSANLPTSWSWSFNPSTVTYIGGTNSGSQHPQLTFNAAGTYSVSLTATNALGSDTEIKTAYINATVSSTGTYTAGDIPTDYSFQSIGGSSSCPGSLTVAIPSGATITGVDVEYEMTALSSSNAWLSEQRSQLRCVSASGTNETTLYSGTGNVAGTQSYSRSGLTIANGVTGGGNIIFQLHAGRSWGGSGCNTTYNKVDNNTWSITVYYTVPSGPPNDDCANATPINEVTDLAFDTSPATASGVQPTCGGSSVPPKDIWFVYTATQTGTAIFDLCGSSFNTRLTIWDACGGSELACNDNSCGLQSSISMPVSVGSSYYVQVGGYNTITGTGDLTIQIHTPGLWTGAVSNDWDNTDNWDDKSIPGSGINVLIPATPLGGLHPETNTGSDAICGNLTIAAGAHLHVPANATLTVNGVITNNAGADGLVLKSDNSGTASLIHNTANVEAKVEQYLSDGKWHFIGMPVSNAYAGVFHLPSGHSDIYLRTHIESTNTWDNYIVPVTTPLILGRGYETWVGTPGGFSQPEIVTFSGVLNTGDYKTGVGGFYDLEFTTGHGLNLIANPFPSAIIADIDSWTKKFVGNAVWTWSDSDGNYVYWNGTNGTNGSGWGTMSGGIIPAMQGFFVQTTRNNADLTIPQSARIHSNQAFYKDSEIPLNTLKLEVEANNYSDVIFVSFNEMATEDFDPEFDVKKLFGLPEAPQLYTKIFNDQLSINSLPELTEARTIQLGFECGLPGTYTLLASEIESFDGSVSVFIEDTKNGILQDLSDDPVYSFDYDISDDPGRFVLHFGGPIGVMEISPEIISIYADEKMVYIRKSSDLSGEIAIYDMLGQKLISQALTKVELQKIAIRNGTGYYIVKVQSGKTLTTQKVFIH